MGGYAWIGPSARGEMPDRVLDGSKLHPPFPVPVPYEKAIVTGWGASVFRERWDRLLRATAVWRRMSSRFETFGFLCDHTDKQFHHRALGADYVTHARSRD